MCKMLFIGTKEKLVEIPLDTLFPDLYLENIKGEFLPIADKFVNPHIYFIGTSRGCSCDFGIGKDFNPYEVSELEIEQKVGQEKSLLDPIRKLLGTQDKHLASKIENNKMLIEQERSYFDQTLKLVEIINANTTDQNSTELYCCWAGEYSEPIDESKIVNLNKVNLAGYFEIELREKVKFIRQ